LHALQIKPGIAVDESTHLQITVFLNRAPPLPPTSTLQAAPPAKPNIVIILASRIVVDPVTNLQIISARRLHRIAYH
jgi:hypothetical protein